MKLYQALANKEIPPELQNKTSCLREILDFSRKYRASIAVLIASARRDNFADDVSGWVNWARGNELAGSDLHHLRQIGNLLLDVSNEFYSRLFQIDTEKLLAMSRLPVKDIPKFLKAYPPEKLNRDEIREAVCKCLGEEPKSKTSKSLKYQPDLWSSLDALAEKDEQDFQAMAMDEKFDESSARKLAMGSLGMMTACTTYWRAKGGGDAEILAAVEKQLRDDADALAELRNSMAVSLQTAG